VLIVSITLLVFAIHDAGALTLYVRRVVVAERGALMVGDLVQPMGDVSPQLHEIMQRWTADLADAPLLIPSGRYRAFFGEGGTDGLILVGKRTLVVPAGSISSEEVVLLDRLVDCMEDLGGLGEGSADLQAIRVTGLSPGPISPADISFNLIRAEKNGQLFSGQAEFGFRTALPEGGRTSGRISLRIVQQTQQASGESGSRITTAGGNAADSAVKANDTVAVFFTKGVITVEMQGRAQSTASIGGSVCVYVPESRMSFNGIVIGDKAVSIELP
jgi:hypothetical protein